MQNRTKSASRGMFAAVVVALSVPGLTGVGAAVADPTERECRMFETKPGHECRFGEWRVDTSPPRAGKSCSFGESARSRDLECVAGRWQEVEADSSADRRAGERCTTVGATRVGVGGMLTCRHGARGFTWE
ncbi:hypothetical protein SAMN04489765_4270 [Tsukamurella pulmonis]|uniref:Secreted protein n=1 Tax=Tsukamurella pulmonis TaxID=47312 RepID=A0A1H1HKC0_9ACTN|nr:hypothetical protein [Tsukamurella pulmonis]SDR25548.1 hypothetical protein SAMN04489765_4270 [Tsukamurella pulmonis]SUP14354.1 Uncharacterised protein [Tsukamurella pulmonis]